MALSIFPDSPENNGLIGHEWAANLLQSSIDSGKVGHSYIFAGPPGVGKNRLAQDFALALNCSNPPVAGSQAGGGLRFCGECRPCRLISAGKHPDVTTMGLAWQALQPENQGSANANLKIDTVRAIQVEISRPPKEVPWRIYIVQDISSMQTAAANAFLKTLEEPPRRAILILLAESDKPLLPTIISRCLVLELRAVPTRTLEAALKRTGADEPTAYLLAALSAGRPGWGLKALQDRTRHDLNDRDEALMHLNNLLSADRVKRLAFAEDLTKRWQENSEKRSSIFVMLSFWLGWWRDLALVKAGVAQYTTNVDRLDELKQQAGKLTMLQIKEVLSAITRAGAQLESNVTPRLALGDLFINRFPKI